MRILMSATRRLHTFAVTLHIAALRVGVALSDRSVNAAAAATDTAAVIREEAAKAYKAIASVEQAVVRENRAFRSAAQAEANSLRRGVTL